MHDSKLSHYKAGELMGISKRLVKPEAFREVAPHIPYRRRGVFWCLRKESLVVWAPSVPTVILFYLGEVPAYFLDSYFDCIFMVN